MSTKTQKIAVFILLAFCIYMSAYAERNPVIRELQQVATVIMEPGPVAVPGDGQIEVAFSPNEGAEKLVIKAIDSARSSIHLMAYSFTSSPVVSALLRAKKRGVRVALVVDSKSNNGDDRSGKSKAALGALHTAGVAVRTLDKYAIAHDKVIIVDGVHVQTGSFNYSAAAASRNSENVIVIWNNRALAATYLQHWERNWNYGEDYRPGF